ncbi:TPA: S-layer family protein [Neisseria meningitidis]
MLKTPPTLAAELSGKTGVSISAPYANENSRILLSTTDISSENGKIKIQSYGDQYYYARQSELYTFERRSYKTGKWYNRKHITEVKEHKNAKPDAVNLSASQGIDIKSGGSIDAYATAFDAPKGSINIEAGRKLTLYAVEELNYDKLDSQKRRRFLGISYSKAHDTTTQVMKTALPSRVVAESANLQSGWDTKLQGTQFETTLGGATIRAGVGEQARADAKIILEGIKSSIHTETVSSSKSTLWQKQAGRGSNIETLQLPSFTGPVAPVLSAPGGYIADIPKGNLKTEIEKLAKQPEYAYLKQLQTVKDVNWNQVQLAYDKWDYKQEGLTGAGAAIIALAVAAVTGGVGAGLIGAAQGTASAAVADAAFTALVSQASISLINNKGNIGNTLKELGRSSTVKNLVVAAATAGVADKIGASALNNVSDKQWINNLTVNLANAGSAALINTAVNGGSLKDNLEANILAALVNTAHGEAASKIKQLDQHYITHKIAHAIAGCAAAAANKGKCQDGAIGAVVGEIVGEALVKNTDFSGMTASEIEKAKANITAYAKLVAGATVGVTGGNVDVAANASETAVKNNALDIIWDIGNLVWDGGKWIYAKSIGDKQMAREAAIDFGVDAAAAAVPFVPAGATKISRGGAYVLKAGDEAVDTAKAIQEIQKQTGIKLTYDKVNKVWTTPAGLDYGLDAKHGNRIKHVLAHTIPNPNKPVHSVFNVSRKEVLPLVDEAWRMKGNPLPNDSSVYLVDMKKPIGTKGETKVRIVVQKGTNKIISAYPQK